MTSPPVRSDKMTFSVGKREVSHGDCEQCRVAVGLWAALHANVKPLGSGHAPHQEKWRSYQLGNGCGVVGRTRTVGPLEPDCQQPRDGLLGPMLALGKYRWVLVDPVSEEQGKECTEVGVEPFSSPPAILVLVLCRP